MEKIERPYPQANIKAAKGDDVKSNSAVMGC
jgi:hypothetical protein